MGPWLPRLQNAISRPFCLQNGGGLGYGHDLCGSSGWPGLNQSVFGRMFGSEFDPRDTLQQLSPANSAGPF